MRGGVTANLWSGGELILDSSVRRKNTQFATFFPLGGFFPDNSPSAYNQTELSALSFTPRLNADQTWGDVRLRMIAGLDIYKTIYQSDRTAFEGAAPIHVYNYPSTDNCRGRLRPADGSTFHNDTDISVGGRTSAPTRFVRATLSIPRAPGDPGPPGRKPTRACRSIPRNGAGDAFGLRAQVRFDVRGIRANGANFPRAEY